MAENIAARPDYESEIAQIIRSDSSPKIIQDKLSDYHGSDIAAVMELLTEGERKKLLRICEPAMIAESFEFLDEDRAGEYINEMDIHKAAEVISELEADTAGGVLKEIPKEKRSLIIELLPEEVRDQIKLVSSFDEDEIGSRMITNFISVRDNLTAKQAMKELIEQAQENDNISTIFVEDASGEFYGAMNIRELLTAKDQVKMGDIAVTSFPYVYAHESIDDCIERLKDYSEGSVPVLDNENRMIGVITAQNVIEVVDDEMSEDYAKLAGLTSEEDLKEPLLRSMKKRLPWLITLLFLGLMVSGVVGAFEKVISQLTLIMAFQSLILDMAGNVGTQSLAVTIRVLTDEDLSFQQKLRLFTKELRVGFCNGLILGSLSFLLVGLYIKTVKHKAALFSFAVSGCIGTALLAAMLISSAVGTLVPMFFKKIKVDPAVASGPLITTMNDLVAVVSYYGLSWLLLINVLGLAGN